MLTRLLVVAFCLLFSSVSARATTVIVPDDRELVQKSSAIVEGIVLGGEGRIQGDGHIETVYEVRVQRVLKGNVGRVLDVVSPGGTAGQRSTAVSGSAHFSAGDKVLLFLTLSDGQWTPTDMTLGKFRFVTSTGGQTLLLRDAEDIVGFDREMHTHVERVRREAPFIQFIEETIRGGTAAANYFVPPDETLALPSSGETTRLAVEPNATYAARSYATHFEGIYPGRWVTAATPVTVLPGQSVTPRMNASLANPFFKSSLQSATGLQDGGVAMITSALNAWTNDCPSEVNIPYGGTNSLVRNADDGVNTIVWNDPLVAGETPADTDGNIAGSWTGSGVIATAFVTRGNLYSFDGQTDWAELVDSDVVVQDGVTGAEAFVATAMTHEIGHAIGLRHSNLHHDGSACQETDECTGAAIMNSLPDVAYDYTLQTWDRNAVRTLYPGACPVTNVRYDFNGDGKSDILWRAITSGETIEWLMNGASISSPPGIHAGGNLGWTIVGIDDFNGDGKNDLIWRNAATGALVMWIMDGGKITSSTQVHYGGNTGWTIATVGDFNGDDKADILFRNDSSGQLYLWTMNGTKIVSSVAVHAGGNTVWSIIGSADFDGDNRNDILWRNNATGATMLWKMDGATITEAATIHSGGNTGWEIAGLGDTDGDGRADILWRQTVNGATIIWRMNGAATSSSLSLHGGGNLGWSIASIANFDGEAGADLLWRNNSTGQTMLWLLGPAGITSSSSVHSGGNMTWNIITTN